MITQRFQSYPVRYTIAATGLSYPARTIVTPVRTTIKPDVVRRTRPTSLFLNGTTWSSSDRIFSPGAFTLNASGLYYTNVPITHVTYYDGPLAPAPDFTLVENKARKQIQETYVNLSVAMAELPKTSSMIRKNIMNFYEVYRKIRRRDPNLVLMPYYALREKRLRERWLEYQYGIRPLIMEVDGAMRALNARVAKPLYNHGRARDAAEYHLRHRKTIVFESRAFDGIEFERHVKQETQVVYRVAFDTQGVASRLSPYGLTNPLLTAWELIPYSFVADWFINVGDTLASIDSLHAIKAFEGIRSYRTRTDTAFNGVGKVGGHGFSSERVWNRQSTTAISALMRLTYNPHLSITRLTSATALLRQLQANAKSK